MSFSNSSALNINELTETSATGTPAMLLNGHWLGLCRHELVAEPKAKKSEGRYGSPWVEKRPTVPIFSMYTDTKFSK